MTKKSKFVFVAAIIAVFASILIASPTVAHGIRIISMSDIGCKTVAKTNLNNVEDRKLPLLGTGDYRYNCDIKTIKPLWDNIRIKHGTYGNHDVESSTSKAFTRDIMGLGTKGWFTWTIGNIGIIGMNQYADYTINSPQYLYVKAKAAELNKTRGVDWLIFAFHEPIQTPEVEGGHGPAKTFRSIYEPIFQKYHNAFILQSHNHITAFGNVNGLNMAICGSGGQGGDSIGKSNGWEYTESKVFGYCDLDFGQDNQIIGKFIDSKNNLVASHTWVK